MSNGAMIKKSDAVNTFRGMLERLQPQIKMALPAHVRPERLLRIIMTSVQKTPKLLDCTRESLLGAVLQAAQLGLEPDGVLGEAYLVPYGTTAQLIPGYRGLIKLCRQTGQLSTIFARVVHSRDAFSYEYGLQQSCKHTPSTDEDVGDVTHVYAVARLKDGGEQLEVMSKREVDAIRKRSRASGAGPWVTDYEEMAKKTVLRRLCKMLPLSIEIARAVSLDEQTDAGLPQDFDIEVTPEDSAAEAKSKLSVVAERPKAGIPEDDTDMFGPEPGSDG